MNTIDEYQLKFSGRLSLVKENIGQIQVTLEQATHWLPGRGLLAECRTAKDLLEKMEERPVQKLIVTLVGPSGAGKSTLLNALSGDDRLSEIGINRPTTQKVVVYCRSGSDADFLLKDLEPDSVIVESRPVPGLEHLILVDTPDMDSMESEKFHPLLEKTILRTDVLICVLNAENPKRRDTVVFLKRFVDLFPGLSLYVVLNRCDRLPELELKTVILSDLQAHLKISWNRKVDHIFCTSARRHLRDPEWPEDERPIHDYDQFPHLRSLIFEAFNRAEHAVDARLEQADHLLGLVRDSIRKNLSGPQDGLIKIKKDILTLEHKAIIEARSAMKEIGPEMLSGIQALFYQKLTDRWWGPVGWLVALWTRFLMAGAGVLATLRLGNPVLQLLGLITSLLRYQKTRHTVEEASTGGDMAAVLLKYRLTIQQAWPDLAGRLIALGFSHEVRRSSLVLRDEKELQLTLVSSWKRTLEEEMDRRVAKISSFFLQLIFNLPTLAIMGLFAYQSVKSFFLQQTLTSAYFLHAGVSIVMVVLLSFFLLQILVRFVGGWNLINAITKRLIGLVDTTGSGLRGNSIIEEIEAVLRLREAE
jgi:GTPase SAR1 family protein